MSVPWSTGTLRDTGRHRGIHMSSTTTYWSGPHTGGLVMLLDVSSTSFCSSVTPLGPWSFVALEHLPTLCGPHHFLCWALPICTFNPAGAELLWFSPHMAFHTDVSQGESFLSSACSLYHKDTLKNKFFLSLINLYLNKLYQIQASGFL